MSRKFSLAYLTIPGTAPVDQIRIAKEAGYDFVSLRTIPMHLPGEPEFLLHKDAKLFEETRQALKEYDMPVMDIELARVRPDLDINEYDPAFEKAAELGATDVLGSIWTRDKAYYIDQVAKIAEMAKKYGLKYNVEFLPWAGVRNLQEAITLVDTVKADNLYIMVDTLHYLKKGGRITPTAALLGSALNLKPILQLQAGKLDAYKKVRGTKAAKTELVHALKAKLPCLEGEGKLIVQTAYSGSDELGAEWNEFVQQAFPQFQVYSTVLPMSIACHTGPGALGVACVRELPID